MRIPKRFKLIRSLCKGKVLDVGATNSENNLNLHNYLGEQFKVKSVDFTKDSDFVQDLNKSEWAINGKYDTIVAGEIVEHISDTPIFIKNCKKRLKLKGRIILTTPNATSLIYLKNPGWCVNYKNKFNMDNSHIHAFTSMMLVSLLERENFEIIECKYLNEFIRNPLGQIICFLFKRLRGDILIAGKLKS